ncbi:hypothetical protein ACJBUE_00835 [Ralstonia syzygii subsp. celebesensis]|uniref:hypothetical protein n=1 Tax=Ralstonia syzygii TaxID=28097 RepID=UPI00387E1C27
MLFDTVSVQASTEVPSARGATTVGVYSSLGETLPPTATLVVCTRWSSASQVAPDAADMATLEHISTTTPATLEYVVFMLALWWS